MGSTSLAVRLPRYAWRITGKRLFRAIGATARFTRNSIMRWKGQADYKRWNSPGGLEEWWVERTKLIAKLVPTNSRVIEFGAGRRQLEKLLPVGCTYTPSDLVDRGPGTIVCDLNQRPLPDLSAVAPEVAVFGGVLEYIRDTSGVAQWLARSGVSTCLVSFDPAPAGLGPVGWYREACRRSYYGYMNRLTEAKLVDIFKAAGFMRSERQCWTKQVILRFQRLR
jgi:hypothetical protein